MFDFESNNEIIVGWESTYLNVSLDDDTPIVQAQNGRKLSADCECFAMEFDRILPVKTIDIRKKPITAHQVKLPLTKFKKAKFVARQYSQTQIRWNDDKYQHDALIPRWVNVHDHAIFTVWQIVPTINSTPYIKLQQQCLTQENKILSQQQSSQKQRYQYNFEQHNSYIQEEEPNTNEPTSLPSPSASPAPISSSAKPHHHARKDFNPSINKKRMKRFLSKNFAIRNKYKRRFLKTKFICSRTVEKARNRSKPDHRTPIKFSTKYEFCLRYEDKTNVHGKSCRQIWEKMRDEGFNVGKSPAACYKWIHNGSKYYFNLIRNRGNDGYKFSICFIC